MVSHDLLLMERRLLLHRTFLGPNSIHWRTKRNATIAVIYLWAFHLWRCYPLVSVRGSDKIFDCGVVTFSPATE